MKKVIIIFCFFTICACNQNGSEVSNEFNYATLIKQNAKLIIESKLYIDQDNSLNKTGDLVNQNQMDSYLDMLNIPQEAKNSLNLTQVNNTVNKLIDFQSSDNFVEVINNTNLSLITKGTIIKLLEDRKVQDVKTMLDFNVLPENEKETLLVINDITNDYFSNQMNILQASILPFNINTSFLFLPPGCTVSGPNGSGQVNCTVLFTVVGASIGGSCCGPGGAFVGGMIGFVIGSWMK